MAVLYGRSGSGKTTAGLLAMRTGVWVVSTEMSANRVAHYAERLGVDLVGVDEIRSMEELDHVTPPAGVRAMVVDSLNGLGPSCVIDFYAWVERTIRAHGLPCVMIAQTTADDDVRGGESVPHACHVLIHCRETPEGRELYIQKSRFGGPMGIIPWMMPGDPIPRHYYTIEPTKGGRYELRAVPWTSNQVWDALRAGKLAGAPPPPAAAAAVQEPGLYGAMVSDTGGWVEPPDWKRRAEFCKARGITYWKVGYGE